VLQLRGHRPGRRHPHDAAGRERRQVAYFMSAESVKWRKPVRPGDTLTIDVELTKARGKIGRAQGACLVRAATWSAKPRSPSCSWNADSAAHRAHCDSPPPSCPPPNPPACPTAAAPGSSSRPSSSTGTQKVVQRIERALGCSFLTYWNSNNGSVCQNDVLGILRRSAARAWPPETHRPLHQVRRRAPARRR